MKRKIGVALNSLPLGIIVVLLEYHGLISSSFPKAGYLFLFLLTPIVTILLIKNHQQRGFYRLLFLSYIVSIILGFLCYLLVGAPPSYWIKPFSPSGLAVFLPTFNLIVQLTFLFIINLSRGFVEILRLK